MPEEVRLWQVGAGQTLQELQRTSLDLETRLQKWLADDISVLDPHLFVIGLEVKTDFGGSIDLLCMDSDGNLVIVELKRDKTPREIVAQALDYASWVADLSNERVRAIADAYLGEPGFSEAFRKRFDADAPDTLNGEHRILIVGSQIDASSERIVKYLSDQHGVNINAATFQFFRTLEGEEFLARVFLIEPSEVDLHSRTKGTSKRRPNLTYEELSRCAEEAGVHELYEYAVSAFGKALQKNTTRSSVAFSGLLEGSRKTVVSLLPGESNSQEGLRYQLYKHRFGSLVGIGQTDVRGLLPEGSEDWIYHPGAEPDYEGYQGFLHNSDDVDRLARTLETVKRSG